MIETLAEFSLRIAIELHPGQNQFTEASLKSLRQRASTWPARAVEVHHGEAAFAADDAMVDPRPDHHDIPGDRVFLAHDRQRPAPPPDHARDGVRAAPDTGDVDREHRARKGGFAGCQGHLQRSHVYSTPKGRRRVASRSRGGSRER